MSFHDFSKPLFTRLSELSVVFKSCKFETVCNKYATYMQQNSLIKDAFNLKASFFFCPAMVDNPRFYRGKQKALVKIRTAS